MKNSAALSTAPQAERKTEGLSMTKPRAKDVFQKFTTPKKETLMDKTTRVVHEMIDDETKQRQAKVARLRQARLEKETANSDSSAPKTPGKAGR